jgi:dTDP-4-dehydrorhamnose reductase
VIVLVAGARGLVGGALGPLLAERGHRVVQGDLPEVDLRRPDALAAWLEGERPDWVVNLAALTDVDGCEKSPGEASACNGAGAGNLAVAASRRGARLLQVSTDYVFEGSARRPLAEGDLPHPLSAYGRSKLEGERAAAAALPPDRLLVVRGQSLYGAGGKSFPDAILDAARTRAGIPVVTDQVVSPTWTRDFAGGLALLMEKGASGTFHLSSAGHCTWNEFAKAVLEDAGVQGVRITDTTAAALGRPARRPAWSVFDLRKFERTTGLAPRPWREQLRAYLRSSGRAA